MKKRPTVLLTALTITLLLSGPVHALDLVYDGLDFYMHPLQSTITFESIAPNGLWLFTIGGGLPVNDDTYGIYVSEFALGLDSGYTRPDSIPALGLFIYPNLYLFTTSVSDYSTAGTMASHFFARIIIFEYDPSLNGLRLTESYYNHHAFGGENESLNTWTMDIPPNNEADIIYYLR